VTEIASGSIRDPGELSRLSRSRVGIKSRRCGVAWDHRPLERPDGIPMLERSNEKSFILSVNAIQ